VDLLIVGSRGYGPVGSVFHGSVSSYLERHAASALLVLPRDLDESPSSGAPSAQEHATPERAETMATRSAHAADRAQAGDWVHARGLPGQSAREGQIVEVLGRPGHEHYRVRWDEQHESIRFPSDGVTVIPGHSHK
jgi:hypothetical protein